MSSKSNRIHHAHAAQPLRHLITLAAACAAMTAAVAVAETAPAQVTLQYSQAELARTSEARELYARLQTAARGVCRQISGTDLQAKRMRDDCYRSALATAVGDVNHAAVTALHNADSAVRLAQGRADTMPRT
jgi:UrcA family protein